ncbi:MAG: hypothetical protein N2376_08885, partial [Clostridia bacterium]|nr:hypothetical protein [Clostridia bacterium]
MPGEPVMVPPPQKYEDLMKRKDDQTLSCVDWYLCYKKDNVNKPKLISIDDLKLPPGPMEV